jgi:hypothetical protein
MEGNDTITSYIAEIHKIYSLSYMCTTHGLNPWGSFLDVSVPFELLPLLQKKRGIPVR